MILCTVNTYEKTVTLTSLLRDTLVQYPNYTDTNGKKHSGGKIKLTSIYHNGYICTNSTADAMGLMNQTLYSNFGIEVDYDVEIDFDAFIKAINLLGGINVELTAAEANYLNDFHDRYYYEVKEGKKLAGRLYRPCLRPYAEGGGRRRKRHQAYRPSASVYGGIAGQSQEDEPFRRAESGK